MNGRSAYWLFAVALICGGMSSTNASAQAEDYKISKEERDANRAREAARMQQRREELRNLISQERSKAASAQAELDYAISAAPQLEANVNTLRNSYQMAQSLTRQCYSLMYTNLAQNCAYYINNENSLLNQVNEAIRRYNSNNNNWNNAANRVNRANERVDQLFNELNGLTR